MNLKEITQSVKEFLFEVFGKDGEVIGVVPYEDGWQVSAELVMDEDYTIKRGRSDLLYVFEIIMDENYNITSYSRTRIRERGKLLDD